jgi:LCP family protein required for cell wall assembly
MKLASRRRVRYITLRGLEHALSSNKKNGLTRSGRVEPNGFKGEHKMSDTSTEFYTRQAAEARGPDSQGPPKRKHKKLKRILIASGTSLVLVVGALVGTTYFYVNNLASKVHRIDVAALTAKVQPSALRGSVTILLTDTQVVPGANTDTGLVELLHLNANQKRGGMVSFPANLVVKVPGHGRMQLGHTLAVGGPSLMVETIEHLTNVRINDYSAIDFAALPRVVGAMGGVDVDVPFPVTSFGFHFHAGINHLTAANALAYVRQPGVSEVGRMQLQENLLRAILDKIGRDGMFKPGRDLAVLDAVVKAVSVDSTLSNSQLEHLALRLSDLKGRDGVSIDVPTTGSPRTGDTENVFLTTRIAKHLWQAIRDDNIAGFAQRYPQTVTPGAPA